jgi:hypothetical protein
VIYLFGDYGDLAQLSVGPEQGPVWTEIIVPTRTAVERGKLEMIRSLNVMQKGGGAEQQIALPERLPVPCVITALFTPVLGLPDIRRETLLVLSRSIACVWLTDRFGLR